MYLLGIKLCAFLTVHCGVFVTPNLRLLAVFGVPVTMASPTRVFVHFHATHILVISIGCPMHSKCAKVAYVPPFLELRFECFGMFVISKVHLLAAIGVPLTMASTARTLSCFHATRLGQPNHFNGVPYAQQLRQGSSRTSFLRVRFCMFF